MKLIDKLLMQINYDNIYSIKRALIGLDTEFKMALSSGNKQRASEIIILSEKLYNSFPNKKNVMISIWKKKAEKMHKYFIYQYGDSK